MKLYSTAVFCLAFFTTTGTLAQTSDNLADDNQNTNDALIINLNAVQTAFNDSNNTDNIKICRYSNRTICKVRIRERMPAVIRLPKYDKIQSWVLGDEKNFSFDVIDNSQQRALLRGIYPGADTNLNIIGESGFIYSFYVRIDSSASKHLSDFIVNLRLNNKDKKTLYALETARRKKALSQKEIKDKTQKATIANLTKPSASELDYLDKKALINVADLNLNFKQVSGDKALMPSKIFDDGIWTYFKYGDKDLIKSQNLPTVFRVKDGFDTLVNSRIEGGYLVAETTSDKWTIRLGQAHACVHKIEDI